jgi:hypothetical protein
MIRDYFRYYLLFEIELICKKDTLPLVICKYSIESANINITPKKKQRIDL